MSFNLKTILVAGKELLPLVEGGKGIGISNGMTAGAWAAQGGIGTFSGANPDYYDENGNYSGYHYIGRTRKERHAELIAQSIKGCLAQAKIAREYSKDAFINMNVLWEMGGCETILEETLKSAKGLINGITCGAGMPYKLAEICARYRVFYFPIVSSMRAFRVLWKRTYKNFREWLGAVVYEDPWVAGGHNGLSSAEDPKVRQDPYARVAELRTEMNSLGLHDTPIIIAGGVWQISEWSNYLDNPEIGSVGFQFGTRPLLTKESPISGEWKKRLLELKEGDVLLNNFSPTGFYSSGVYNRFMQNLDERSKRQIEYANEPSEVFDTQLSYGERGRCIYIKKADEELALKWFQEGFNEILRTPDETVVFESTQIAKTIVQDQRDCMGCLSRCKFSNWDQHDETTSLKPDPRSFCIQKTLQDVAHGGSIEDNLMFSGANVFRFGSDDFYKDGFIPSVKELVDHLKTA